MKQFNLFGEEVKPGSIKPKPIEIEITVAPTKLYTPPDKTHTIEALLEHIENEMYLWDMRAWDERNREQAEQWVRDIKDGERDHKNCGHVLYCIGNLLGRDIEEKVIVDAIMRNERIQYPNRLVKCFGHAPCPKRDAQGGYGGDVCVECEGKPRATPIGELN